MNTQPSHSWHHNDHGDQDNGSIASDTAPLLDNVSRVEPNEDPSGHHNVNTPTGPQDVIQQNDPAQDPQFEEWKTIGYHCRTFLSVLFVSWILLASAKNDKSEWMENLEYLNAFVLCFLFVATAAGTVWFIISSDVKKVAIGTRTEHLSASIMGSIIALSSIAKLIWDPETTGIRKIVESWTIFGFTISNIAYVWFHNRIDIFNGRAYVHQTLHFALSLTLAFTAEFLEVQEIVKKFHHMNLTMEYEVYDEKYGRSATEILESLGSFLFSLNFEFHFLLANYAYLISIRSEENDEPHTVGPHRSMWEKMKDFCKSTDARSAFLLFSLTVVVISLYFVEAMKNVYKHIYVAVGIVVVLVLVLIVSGSLYCLSHNEPSKDDNKHENKVILCAAYGLLFSTIGGIPYSIQAICNSKQNSSAEAITSLLANICSSLGIFTQTSVLRLYHERKALENETPEEEVIRKKKTSCEKKLFVCLGLLNATLFISNMLEVCQMGVHSSAPEPIVHVEWLIMNRALESIGVFYRLASCFRCVHHLTEHDTPATQPAQEAQQP